MGANVKDRGLQRKVSQMMRMRGWDIRPDAMAPLCQLLSTDDDTEGNLNLLLKRIEDVAGASRIISAAVIAEVVSAANTYPCQDEHSANLCTAKSRAPLTRFGIIKERVRRHPMFDAAHVHHEAGRRKIQSVHLSRIGSLRGRRDSHVLLGLLTETDAGTILLSDEDGSIPLDISHAHTSGGFFTPFSTVLVEGSINSAGMFEVAELGHPPCERGVHLNDAAPDLPNENAGATDAMLLVFSDIHLDQPETLLKLEMVLHGYEIAGKQLMETGEHRAPFAETFTFVFCGNFSSVPHTPDTPRSEILLLFKRFAELLGRFPVLKQHAHFIFIAGPSDPSLGPATTLQHPPLPEVLIADIRAVLIHCQFASNPARIMLGSQQVVLYREEILARLKCSTLLPLREEPGVTLSEHLVDIVVQQAHLCPLPFADSTSFAPSAFFLERTPDVLILAESRAQFTANQAGTVAFNPGSFAATGRWMVYHTREGKAESSSL